MASFTRSDELQGAEFVDADLRGGLEFETFIQGLCRETEDSKEGPRAFMEKREPQWRAE